MSDISDLSSDSTSSVTSWSRDFEPEFINDFMNVRSPLPQDSRYISQSSIQSTSIQHGYAFAAEPVFINENSYDWRAADGLPSIPNNQSIVQPPSPPFHHLSSFNHDTSSPIPKRARQSTLEPINNSSHQVVSQSINQSGHLPFNQPELPSSLSNVIAAAKSITVPTLASMNLANSTSSSKRKRRNSSERSSESSSQSNAPLNRAEVKKQKHREIDAVRRQREATVITRLQELNAQHSVLFEQCESSVTGASGKRSVSPSSRSAVTGQAKDKVSVLEESADKTAALQELCRKLTETCAKQQESINHLTEHVTSLAQKLQVQADDALTYNQTPVTSTTITSTKSSSSSDSSFLTMNEVKPITQHFSALPPHVQEYLGQMDRSFALYSSCFLQATVCIMIISVKTGRLIDANSCFFRTSGWTADQIIGRVLTAPLEFVLGRRSSSMTEVERLLDEQTRPLVRRNGQLVPARRVPQYPRSKQKFKDLVTGAADQIEAIWRSELADGNMYEVKNICYSGKRETVEDERGRVFTRPVHVVFACSALDGIKLT